MSSVWERNQTTEEVSYVKEMLTSQTSLHGLLGSLAVGSLIAFPFGFAVAAIPVICFAAAEAVAALFIPSSASFRNMVDTKKRRERREQVRTHLQAEIERRITHDPLWDLYGTLCERVQSLRRLTGQRASSLSERELERLDDATVDFLSLWLGRLTMLERLDAIDESALRHKIAAIDKQLSGTTETGNRRHLQQAKSDLERVLTRRERLLARHTAVEAAQLSLADTFDEIYQGIMTNPATGDNNRQLQEAVARLQIEEELDLSTDDVAEIDERSAAGASQNDRNNARRTAADLRHRAREPQG